MSSHSTIFNISRADAKALRDDDLDWISRAAFLDAAEATQKHFVSPAPALVFVFARNTVGTLVATLAAQQCGHAVALINPDIADAAKTDLLARYDPNFVVTQPAPSTETNYGLSVEQRREAATHDIHPDVSLLLSTSGSTGTPKFVKLTARNLQFNAASICKALDLKSSDIASGHLPLHYSFGLSVVTSHLLAGGAISLTEKGLMDREFWARIKGDGVTTFGGVPWHYETLHKMRLERLAFGAVRLLMQAGGPLSMDLKRATHAFSEKTGKRFCVMYGQTEAAPRITTLAHDDFPEASASVGQVLDGGKITIEDETGEAVSAGVTGHIVYTGDNVMMGYAKSASDLAEGDVMSGRLETGDMGHLSAEGHLTVTGRKDALVKIAGLRVDLAEVETLLSKSHPVKIVKHEEKLCVFYVSGEGQDDAPLADLKTALANYMSLPPTVMRWQAVDAFPINSRGKLDRSALRQLCVSLGL